ncbi:MAG: DnaJ domain-containing protein [Candidatus Limnocylindrales bacterium]
MKKRDPHVVLGVDPGASAATVKAAWRRLVRANHPDLNPGDPVEARAATARMVEINAAYEHLRQGSADPARGTNGARSGASADAAAFDASGTRRGTGGVPPPRPTRPVTAHLDTSEVLHAHNRTTSPAGPGARSGSLGQPARRSRAADLGPRRASDPTGPARRSHVRNFQAPEPPALEVALATEMTFGKFHGHSLGQIAAFEPSYIDWVSGTITRDPELVAAARVVRSELDRRGVVRRVRETHEFHSAGD